MPLWHNNISPDKIFFHKQKNESHFIKSGMPDSEIYVNFIRNETYTYF